MPNFPLRVESPYVSTGMDCHKCHNRILLKNRKFYRLDPPNHLDRRFTGTKEGIGLVRTGIVVSCFLPIAFVIGIFSGIFTFSLLGFFTPIVLCLGISLAMQLRGVWFCLQTPDCNLGRQWIVATAWLQGISLVLIVLQAILREASWLNLPIGGVIFAGQLTFLTYLVMLATFLKRPDLASNFRELRLDSIIIFVGTSAINLGLPFLRDYEIQLLILLGLQGAACLRRYLRELKLLKWHLDKITTGQSA
ncbi:MAG: hypothetical protein NZ772_08350 [Cyanobacteria bacterium]|nr:hypothetical protein [Cyanobacteriota bacterium]